MSEQRGSRREQKLLAHLVLRKDWSFASGLLATNSFYLLLIVFVLMLDMYLGGVLFFF